jgi:GTP-binding protein
MEVEFLGSFAGGTLPRHRWPEIAVGGRSNVGKSSFINTVLGRRDAARVSSKPGKTRTINLYLCDGRLVLADLPGYGYAKASKSERSRWARDIDAYFRRSANLRAVVLLVDVRHFPLERDLQAMDWLSGLGKPLLVVLTKSDKLSRSELSRRLKETTGIQDVDRVEFIAFSTRTGLGKKEVWSWIERMTA